MIETIKEICHQVDAGRIAKARAVAQSEIPFAPIPRRKRRYTDLQALRVFRRDGFIDRYSGEKLVFPAALRLLSLLLPREIPYHPNWKTTECHLLFWRLSPTVDHVVPVARGGVDAAENWVCTSMLRNSAKAHWTLEELGWKLRPCERDPEWDGMVGWFVDQVNRSPAYLENPLLRRWHRACSRAA